MSAKFANTLIRAVNFILQQVEISFVAKVISFDKSKMTAEIAPLLKTVSKQGQTDAPVITQSQNLKDVRVEKSPGVRPPYKAGDLVRVLCAASQIDEAIEKGLPVNTLEHRFSAAFCTVIGRVDPRTFPIPSHYSNDGLILGEDPNFYINFKSDQIYHKGKQVLADNLEVKGNTRSLVTHGELDSAMQLIKTWLNTHTHVETGATTNVSLPPISIDISSAKTDNIKTGAG